MKTKFWATLLGSTAAAAVYLKLIRPRLLHWGATEREVQRPLPGDDIVGAPNYQTTRAMTVENGPEDIWPWIAQLGEQKGGFYSYDLLERLLGMKVHSAHRILPRYQDVETGDALDRKRRLVVADVEPKRALVVATSDDIRDVRATWTIALFPFDDRRTRLVSRVRARFDLGSPRALAMLALAGPGQFVMERKCLREIKLHAEGLAEKWPPETPVTLH